MKKLFYISLLLLTIFEISNVYLIMPLPGSQEINSISIAYFLYSWRWVFRILFALGIVLGLKATFSAKRKWIPVTLLLIGGGVCWFSNFKMAADHMFLQPHQLIMLPKSTNTLPGDRLVVGVEYSGVAKAYPIEFLTYHHQVLDTISGRSIMVTYCSVCRTGRVYEPTVNGQPEQFRLVGMDHFNAMFEDDKTHSWWRQASGEAISGSLKGQTLPEVKSVQMTIDKWFELYPNALVMQPDPTFASMYDPQARFEKGKYQGGLTGTDSISWQNKSWVIGIQHGDYSKAYDWNVLKKKNIIHDAIGGQALVLAISSDGGSFAAFERTAEAKFELRNDLLLSNGQAYNLAGKNITGGGGDLNLIQSHQEFWHSWLTFHPQTEKFE